MDDSPFRKQLFDKRNIIEEHYLKSLLSSKRRQRLILNAEYSIILWIFFKQISILYEIRLKY